MENLQIEITNIAGAWTPLLLLVLFAFSSLLIIWRLESWSTRGAGSRVLAKLLMPYFSGLGNLVFVWVVLYRNGPAEELAINAWTNNLTNLCLLLALPALTVGLNLNAKSRTKQAQRESNINRLSLALSLVAMILFSLTVWVLGQDGEIDRFDGFSLVGLFACWQCFHIFERLKENTGKNSGWHPMLVLDVLIILVASFGTLLAVDGIVDAIMEQEDGFFSGNQLGLLTGWLMVLPNAALAFYYARSLRDNAIYRTQVSDGHICIPLCIGLFAIFKPMPLPLFFQNGLLFISAVALVHLLCVALLRRLPKLVATGLITAYAYALFIQLSR